MSDGSLSQDEIDALLQGGGGFDLGSGGGSSQNSGLSGNQLSEFTSIIQGNTSTQSGNLGGMIGKTVTIGTPAVEEITREDFLSSAPDEVVEVRIDLTEAVSGDHSYIFPASIATMIAGHMMGQDQIELDDAALSALSEAGNTLAGGLATALGEKAGGTVMTAPGETQKTLKASVRFDDERYVRVTYPVTIEGEAPGEYYELFSLPIITALSSSRSQGAPDMGAAMGMGQPGRGMQSPAAQQAMNPMMNMGGMGNMGGMQGGVGVQSVQFPNLYQQPYAGDQGNIGLLMDVYMEMTVELGRTKRLIKEILSMGEGTIIELDKLAGEPVDILVNHKLIARGEVVVIDENFGVRVTEIVSPMDQIAEY
ncbi:MAG: flagellar motor switch protein FliN [Spirochaetales bacterium]|nr:flagellar motor switch protein FliN [Spirochaetales bacterium]